jgi:ABC-2 type transport system permease protein
MKKFFIDLWVLWLEQMGEVRVNWPLYLIYSVIFPIILVFGFTHLGSGLSDKTSLLYIISGSIIMSLSSDGIVIMATNIGQLKRENSLMYYASLPINRLSFVLALILSRFVVMLPGMITPLIFGIFAYDFDVSLNLWLFLLIPMISLSCSIFGLFLGMVIESANLINIIANAVMVLVLLAAPIFMPYDALPLPLQWLSYLIPLSYAAAALRDAIAGTIGLAFYFNMGVMLAVTAAALVYLTRFWQWRIR